MHDSDANLGQGPAVDQAAAPVCTPGPRNLVAFDGHVDPLAFLGQLIDEFGHVSRYQTRYGPCIFFVRPDHIQTILHSENYLRASLVKVLLGDGLLSIDGPRWRSQRRLMQRDFLPPGVAPFHAVMVDQISRTTKEWHTVAQKREPIDVAKEMTRLTLRIVVDALFGEDLSEDHCRNLCAAITQILNDVGRLSWTIFGVPAHFTPASTGILAAAKKVVDSTCYELIARRRAQSPADRRKDLLTMLIQADTETGAMTDLQLRDEIVTMLVGGHETTALSLSWAWKAIAENPEVESRLHQELDEKLAGQLPTLEDLQNLSWTRGVFQEALRLYPPVWYMARVAAEEDTIDGHHIPKGARVLVSAWFTHRHKDFWPNPDRFDPSRFLNPAAQHSHRYAYFPFGGGRHTCLGNYFAQMEGVLILAQLAQQFRVRPLNSHEIKPDPGITLRQLPGLQASIESRQFAHSHATSGAQ